MGKSNLYPYTGGLQHSQPSDTVHTWLQRHTFPMHSMHHTHAFALLSCYNHSLLWCLLRTSVRYGCFCQTFKCKGCAHSVVHRKSKLQVANMNSTLSTSFAALFHSFQQPPPLWALFNCIFCPTEQSCLPSVCLSFSLSPWGTVYVLRTNSLSLSLSS